MMLLCSLWAFNMQGDILAGGVSVLVPGPSTLAPADGEPHTLCTHPSDGEPHTLCTHPSKSIQQPAKCIHFFMCITKKYMLTLL